MAEPRRNPSLRVIVGPADFDVAELQRTLIAGDDQAGAVATFTGYVRGSNAAGELQGMVLEHYPGMTEKSLYGILQQAATRWPVLAACVVHRIGELRPGEQIVWVGVSSPHRQAAFAACEFIMDYLKTQAPFWKKEIGPDGARWVDERESDLEKAGRW